MLIKKTIQGLFEPLPVKFISVPKVAHDSQLESSCYTVTVDGGNYRFGQLHFGRPLERMNLDSKFNI
jgi:hypothetical protein